MCNVANYILRGLDTTGRLNAVFFFFFFFFFFLNKKTKQKKKTTKKKKKKKKKKRVCEILSPFLHTKHLLKGLMSLMGGVG